MLRSHRPLACVLAALVVISACTTGDGTTTTSTAGSATPPPTTDVPSGLTATLVRGLDGDSFRVDIDGTDDEVRLAGINAPEGDECYGDEARRILLDLIDGVPLTLVRAEAGERDRFGRRIALVYADGVLVNAEMVRRGAALAYHADLDIAAELLAAADRAAADRIGMWAVAACQPAAADIATIAAVVADAPGRDEDNPNGEWAEIANPGTTPIDMSDWGLRDETSANRYRFPEGFVLAAGATTLVHSGCGTDTVADLYWCNDGPVWTNAGDTALLSDPAGNIVARVSYP